MNKQTNEDERIKFLNVLQKIIKITKEADKLVNLINKIIQSPQSVGQYIFEHYYQKHKEIEFVNDFSLKSVCTKELYKEKNEIKLEDYNITEDFYEGLGHDIKNYNLTRFLVISNKISIKSFIVCKKEKKNVFIMQIYGMFILKIYYTFK